MGQCICSPRASRDIVLGRDIGTSFWHLYYPDEYCPHHFVKKYPRGTLYQVVRPQLIIVDEQEVYLTNEQSYHWGLKSC